MYYKSGRRTKLIIAGDTRFFNYAWLKEKVDQFIETNNIDRGDVQIVIGADKGASWLGGVYAKAYDIPTRVFRANHRRYKDGAIAKRNAAMADYATHCIVFPIFKQSIESYDMAKKALESKLVLAIWETKDGKITRVDF